MEQIKRNNRNKLAAYRFFLYILLIFGTGMTTAFGYYSLWCRIPATIMVKSGMEETFDFQVPAKGILYKEAVETSAAGQKTIADSGLMVDFSRPVTMKAEQIDSYKLKVRLFGVIPLKDVSVEVIDDVRLKPAGIPIGIYVKTEGVLVVGVGEFEGESGESCSPAHYILQPGDYILEVNDEPVKGKKQFMETVSCCEGQNLILKIKRNEEELYVMTKPQLNEQGEYKLGIWIRDNAQGVGTMTYIDETGHFGALGHGINDVDTSTLMALQKGTLYHTEIIGITKGSNGSPGELTGFIEYDDRNILGTITENTTRGIFGVCSPDIASEEQEALPVGLKQEIEAGPAQIRCSIGGDIENYEVEITDINLGNDNINRGIVLQITDERLLSETGGIVQGMSGSPIIQNGKIIGAVTHVLVQDSTKGYGIFIERMLEKN